MEPDSGNLYANLPEGRQKEDFLVLVSTGNLRIERIVSFGHATAKGEWLDQDRAEWVILLQGTAALRFEGKETPQVMVAGDYMRIPAHCRHRVEWTSADPPAIWLAVHHDAPAGGEI